MPLRQKTNDILSPELIKILKIFGLISIGLVFTLSFFNTRRANNSGEDLTFHMTSSSRLYFLNVRAINYDREVRPDAGMILFRHGKRATLKSKQLLDMVIILNNPKDEAYLYLEPVSIDWPLEIKASLGGKEEIFQFKNGNNTDVLRYIKQLEPWIFNEAKFELKVDSNWIPLWSTPKEKESIKSILEDYYKLINERE
ncbi:hypothetical protein LV84_01564 [Algoriphagus ratkowskyi]|uniref:Uncharacterized protein n=1 Tax=Algoriphagus ratkowskyi TaxID=57028 RepID=A0A2W7RBR2_9BACT|nr:hypothetical protein [Algoriphagus ratkowskyi]PZX58358.1 hypothetical protein LV84_01564 [Algoriphagus ratkowskyi]TXD77773.1 hypothetical protein ESW18_10400 [Algoriphagus ratkowskyi]